MVFSKFSLLQSTLARILESEDNFYRFYRENSSQIQVDRKKTSSFPSAPTVFVGVKIFRQINLELIVD